MFIYIIFISTFILVGSIFIIVGRVALKSEGDKITYKLCSTIGRIAIIIGLVAVVCMVRENYVRKSLIKDGDCVIAEITEVLEDNTYRINGRSTYVLECSYLDTETDKVYIFKSDNMERDLSRFLRQDTVKVYVDRDSNFKNYYVDVDSLFEHIEIR